MLIETLSVFPEMFEPVMSTSILGRARKAGLFDFKAYNLRDWTHDRHRTVDDEPYGGGQGMLMKVEPIAEAIEAISSEGPKPTVVFFTPCGEPFTQHVAERLLKSERLLFVCSRYEGVDELVRFDPVHRKGVEIACPLRVLLEVTIKPAAYEVLVDSLAAPLRRPRQYWVENLSAVARQQNHNIITLPQAPVRSRDDP